MSFGVVFGHSVAVIVSVEDEPVAGFGLNEAVMPWGNPLIDSVTGPVNPPERTMLTEVEALTPRLVLKHPACGVKRNTLGVACGCQSASVTMTSPPGENTETMHVPSCVITTSSALEKYRLRTNLVPSGDQAGRVIG
jgi:hypothetical protein